MKPALFSLLFTTLFGVNAFSQKNATPATFLYTLKSDFKTGIGDTLYVWATALHLRAAPSPTATSLAVLPNGVFVVALDSTNDTNPHITWLIPAATEKAGNNRNRAFLGLPVEGHWLRVQYRELTGYIFDGYMAHIPVFSLENIARQTEEASGPDDPIFQYLNGIFTRVDTTHHMEPGIEGCDYTTADFLMTTTTYSNGMVVSNGYGIDQGCMGRTTRISIPKLSKTEGVFIAHKIWGMHFSVKQDATKRHDLVYKGSSIALIKGYNDCRAYIHSNAAFVELEN